MEWEATRRPEEGDLKLEGQKKLWVTGPYKGQLAVSVTEV